MIRICKYCRILDHLLTQLEEETAEELRDFHSKPPWFDKISKVKSFTIKTERKIADDGGAQ